MQCPFGETRAITERCSAKSCDEVADLRPSKWLWEGICRCPHHGTVCSYCVPIVNKERTVVSEPIDLVVKSWRDDEGQYHWIKNCALCGKPFETTNARQRFHNDCAVQATRIRSQRISKSERNARLFKTVHEYMKEREKERKRFQLMARENRRAVCRVCQRSYPWTQLVALPVDGNFLNLDPMNAWVVCFEHATESIARIYGLTEAELHAEANSSDAYLTQFLDRINDVQLFEDEKRVFGY